jgi:hypothetical protein
VYSTTGASLSARETLVGISFFGTGSLELYGNFRFAFQLLANIPPVASPGPFFASGAVNEGMMAEKLR